jgi:citrate lyase subunit beta/citryl-CoA lyase
MLPKAKVQELKELDKLLTKLENERKLTKKIKVIPIIELAASVLQVEEIASLNRVDGILLGAEDLTSDMEVARTKGGKEIEYARCRVAMACKAYQIDAIDTPFTDVNDPEGLRVDALNAQTLAMNAKSAIHPNQIDTINEVFLPAPKLINWAKRVKMASDEALAKGIGVFSLDGKMVDKPVIERAMKILKKAERFNAL